MKYGHLKMTNSSEKIEKFMLVIPSKSNVEFKFRQPVGEIDDNHARLLATSAAAILREHSNPAFLKTLIEKLSKK
jgi:hypothetical protein